LEELNIISKILNDTIGKSTLLSSLAR